MEFFSNINTTQQFNKLSTNFNEPLFSQITDNKDTLKLFNVSDQQMLNDISSHVKEKKEFMNYLTKNMYLALKNQDPFNENSNIDPNQITQEIHKVNSEMFDLILEGRKILQQGEVYSLLQMLNKDVLYHDAKGETVKNSQAVSLERFNSELFLKMNNGEKISKDQILSIMLNNLSSNEIK